MHCIEQIHLQVQKENIFREDVGVAMPKPTETRCKDGCVQARLVIQSYTRNPIPTSWFHHYVGYAVRLLGERRNGVPSYSCYPNQKYFPTSTLLQ